MAEDVFDHASKIIVGSLEMLPTNVRDQAIGELVMLAESYGLPYEVVATKVPDKAADAEAPPVREPIPITKATLGDYAAQTAKYGWNRRTYDKAWSRLHRSGMVRRLGNESEWWVDLNDITDLLERIDANLRVETEKAGKVGPLRFREILIETAGRGFGEGSYNFLRDFVAWRALSPGRQDQHDSSEE